MELSSCHLSGAKRFKVTFRFLKNFWTSAVKVENFLLCASDFEHHATYDEESKFELYINIIYFILYS
jgi:hypothetical protein